MIDEKTVRDLEHRFDERYVLQDDCNRQLKDTYLRIEDVKVNMTEIKTRLNMIIAILGAIGVAAIGICAFVVQTALKI